MNEPRLRPAPASQYDQRLSYEEWLAETIGFFRSIGFFENFQGLDDHEVLNRLHEKREKQIHDTWEGSAEGDDAEDLWILETKTDTGGSSTTTHSDPSGWRFGD